jgi:integrase/recombinase XerD
MAAAGVPARLCHPHVLRHTYGSLFMRRGGELAKLQALMGHASPATTAIYIHHSRASLEAAVAANETRATALERHAEHQRRRQR